MFFFHIKYYNQNNLLGKSIYTCWNLNRKLSAYIYKSGVSYKYTNTICDHHLLLARVTSII